MPGPARILIRHYDPRSQMPQMEFAEIDVSAAVANQRIKLEDSPQRVDVGGRQMRLIGRIDGVSESDAASPSGRRYHWPRSLQWMPDGKRLSFIFRDALYTLPVE
jgi:hypothetical protein